MVWFLVIVGILIFAPGLFLLAGVGVLVLAVPFLIFFGVWLGATYLWLQIDPGNPGPGLVVGFIAGIYVARRFVVGATGTGSAVASPRPAPPRFEPSYTQMIDVTPNKPADSLAFRLGRGTRRLIRRLRERPSREQQR